MFSIWQLDNLSRRRTNPGCRAAQLCGHSQPEPITRQLEWKRTPFLLQFWVIVDLSAATKAALNICAQEELMRGSDGLAAVSATPVGLDVTERRNAIKNGNHAIGVWCTFYLCSGTCRPSFLLGKLDRTSCFAF